MPRSPAAGLGARAFLNGWTLFVLFSLSGFVGILAEQVFEKMLSVVVGGTTPAAAIVISVYFIGLSADGWLASFLLKRSRSNSLRLYGLCELGVSVCCLLVWLGFSKLAPWYEPLLTACGPNGACLGVARFFIAGTIILPTAIGLGLSFPFLSDLASSGGIPAHYLAKLYFSNLLGAALCAIAAPYLIFPWIGLSGAILIACAVDLAVACRALQLAKAIGTRQISNGAGEASRPAATTRQALIIGVAFLSGLIFFALEVIWTHLAAVVAGSSVYAFSSMLFVVLLGLALGSMRIGSNARQGKPPAKIGGLLFLSASLLLVQVVLWQWIPSTITLIGAFADGFYGGELARLLTLVLALLPFTYAYGMIYPCLFNEERFAESGAGQLVGYMGFANALGCVLGAALGFFVLIPQLGAEVSLRWFTILLLLCGVVMLRVEGDVKNFKPSLVSAAMIAAIAFGSPAWDRENLTSGSNVYFGAFTKRSVQAVVQPTAVDESKHSSKIVFFHEDSYGGITTVTEDRFADIVVRTLRTNGKFQGDDGQQRAAQTAFTLIPSLHLRRRDNALMIGCGTGQSAGVLNALGFDHVDIAELSPGILKAAAAQFRNINHGVLASPRSTVYVEDGRNVLLRRPDTYDLIAIELTSVWFAGATNIYSHEFYELARRRLRPNGILQQWLQLHHISPREIASVMGTIHKTFPYVSLWLYGGQGVIIAGLEPVQIQPEAKQKVESYLAGRYGADAVRAKYDEIIASRLLSEPEVAAMLAAQIPVINTDWNRWIEFSTPRYNIGSIDWVSLNLKNFALFSTPKASPPN